MFKRKLKKLIYHPVCFFRDIGKGKRPAAQVESCQEFALSSENAEKTEKPAVSVIVPVHNAGKYIHDCIKSLLRQEGISLEFIFVNDASTDNSLDLVRSYSAKDNRIILFDCPHNIGVAAARNLGISLARGEYIGFVDPDDYVSPDYFKTLHDLAIKNDADIAMTCSCVRFPGHGRKNMGFASDAKIDDETKLTIMKTTGVIWNKIYRLDFVTGNTIFFPEIKTMGTDNYVTALSLFFAKKIAVTDIPVYHYRENPESIINRKKDESYYRLTEVYYRLLKRIYHSAEPAPRKKQWIDAVIERGVKDTLSNLSRFENDLQKIEYINSIYRTFPNVKILDIRRPVVSLTSYPARIEGVSRTIRSILDQDIPPREVVLYLADSQFPGKLSDLPQGLTSLCERSLNIRWCKDIRAYKKLIPALRDYPNDIIVTADDDVIYPSNWLRILLTEHFRDPKSIQCFRGRKIETTDSRILPYRKFKLVDKEEPASFFILQTGVGGCLYTADMFFHEVCREDLFMTLCPDGDDVWFWAMAILNGTKIHWCPPGMSEPVYVEGSQDARLWDGNDQGACNDRKFANLLHKYPKLAEILGLSDQNNRQN